jgi:hypothetical protein
MKKNIGMKKNTAMKKTLDEGNTLEWNIGMKKYAEKKYWNEKIHSGMKKILE